MVRDELAGGLMEPTDRCCCGAQAWRILAIVVANAAWLGSATLVVAEEWPRFRKGVWQFERTLELTGVSSDSDEKARVLIKSQMTRCVDPSEAMKETFKPLSVGSCHSRPPQRMSNRYVFPLRCDYMGPVRTTIDVESDVAYTEINELTVGRLPRTDTVIARRIGECGPSS
jgi:hypothetical protein